MFFPMKRRSLLTYAESDMTLQFHSTRSSLLLGAVKHRKKASECRAARLLDA